MPYNSLAGLKIYAAYHRPLPPAVSLGQSSTVKYNSLLIKTACQSVENRGNFKSVLEID